MMPDWRGLHYIDFNAEGVGAIRTPAQMRKDDSPASIAHRDWRSSSRGVCD